MHHVLFDTGEGGTQTLLGEAFWGHRDQGNRPGGVTVTAVVPGERGTLSPHSGLPRGKGEA